MNGAAQRLPPSRLRRHETEVRHDTGRDVQGEPAQLRRYLSRPDWLLTGRRLVIMLSTSVAGGSWQLPAGWAAVVAVLSWLPLTVRASLASAGARRCPHC